MEQDVSEIVSWFRVGMGIGVVKGWDLVLLGLYWVQCIPYLTTSQTVNRIPPKESSPLIYPLSPQTKHVSHPVACFPLSVQLSFRGYKVVKDKEDMRVVKFY